MPLGGLRQDGVEIFGERLSKNILRAAAGFEAAGVRTGDVIAILMRNTPAFVEASLAAQHLGCYAVPINWHLVPPEVGYILRDCEAKLLVAQARFLDVLDGDLPPGIATIRGDDWSRWRDSFEPTKSPPADIAPSMIYTSGTTGNPKGVRRAISTPDQARTMQRIRDRLYGIAPDMRVLMAPPLYHAAPNFLALTTVRRGGELILHERFDAEAMLSTIASDRVTHVFAVPTMFVRLLALPPEVRARYDISSLRCVVHAAAACPVHVKRAMIEWWGPILQEYYGSTEMGAVTFCDSADWLAHPGTVGRAVDPYRITIHGEDGAELSPGERGEIWVEAPGLPDFTYHGDPAKRDAMRRGEAMASGDIGSVDEEGYVFICDRKTDVVISGGVNIYPAEVEAALMKFNGVRDCAVIGLLDREFGEQVVAIIEPADRGTFDTQAVRDHLRA